MNPEAGNNSFGHIGQDTVDVGNPGGSLEATRRSFNKDFLLALAADFKKHGAAAIEKVRKQQPAAQRAGLSP